MGYIEWVEKNWVKILGVLVLMGVGYALIQAVGAWAIPDEPLINRLGIRAGRIDGSCSDSS